MAGANDLVYKSGFENSVLISGSATGIKTSGLKLLLQANNQNYSLKIDSDGSFTFSTLLSVGTQYTIKIEALPNNQSCQLTNPQNSVPAGGVKNLSVVCNDIKSNWNEMKWDESGWQ